MRPAAERGVACGTGDFQVDGSSDILWHHNDSTVRSDEINANDQIQSVTILGQIGRS